MGQAILIIKLLLAIGPAIIEFVKKLEEIMPEGGQGAAKLALLKTYLEGIWAGLGTVVPAFETVWPKIQSVVAAIVSLFNKTGVFKK